MAMRRLLVCLLLVTAALCGCSKDDGSDLKLVPVKGKVTEKGGKQVTSGMLEFRPLGEALHGAAVADVGADGSFTARTVHGRKSRDGMAPGKYEVSYFPPQGEDQSADPLPLEGELTITDAGFPDGNPLKIELPPMRRR